MSDYTYGNLIFWFFLACFIVSFLLLGWLLRPFLSQIILAAVITGLFNPVYKFILVKDKINPPLASFITCLLVFVLIFVPIVFFVGILSTEAYALYLTAKSAVLNEQLKNLLETTQWLERINVVLVNFNMELTSDDLNRAISELGKVVGLFLYNQARLIASNMLTFLVNFFFMLIIIYYLLIECYRLISFIIDLSPLPTEQDEKLINKFKDMAGAILIGNGLGGLIQGTLGGIVFSIFGLQSPFLWGVIM